MFDTDYRLVSGIAIIFHQYFSFLTLLMFNSIDFSLPPKPSALPPLCRPYIENPAAVHGSHQRGSSKEATRKL